MSNPTTSRRIPGLRLGVGSVFLLALVACERLRVDDHDEHGMTALMRAAQAGDSAEAARLIALGAEVNAVVPTRDGRELLAFLAWMQQLPKSDIGYSPLHYAVAGGHLSIARLLLAQGANAHHAARGGTKPFDIAVGRSDLPAMTLLIGAGARPTAAHLISAVSLSSPETVAFLLQHGADPNAVPAREGTKPGSPPPLILATKRGDTTVMRLLLDAGADVNGQDVNGWSALRWVRHTPSRGRDEARVRQLAGILEAAGATDEAGLRADALFAAVLNKDIAGVSAALAAGANPNSRDDRGVPPLIYATGGGVPEIVAALVEAGAAVNASPEHDTTPLISAIQGGNIEVVRILLAAGANVDQADRLRMTPVGAASSWNRTEITSLLLASSATIDPSALPTAALNRNVEQVRMLLARKVDPNANKGHALSEATRGCQRGDNIEVIQLLLEAGADPRVHGDYTALHRAAGLCTPEVVRLLLDRGADPKARDMNGVTPLVGPAFSGNIEIARMLIAAGADVNARDSDGKSILQYAANHPAMQEELRRAGAR